jgi:hypothetical protein
MNKEFEYGSDTAMTSEDLSIKILKDRQYEFEFKQEFSIYIYQEKTKL